MTIHYNRPEHFVHGLRTRKKNITLVASGQANNVTPVQFTVITVPRVIADHLKEQESGFGCHKFVLLCCFK